MDIRSWNLASGLGAAVCIVGAVACGDGEGDSAAQSVRLQLYERPALVAFRDEAAPEWRALPVGTSSAYELPVSGAYEIAIGCEGSGERPSFALTVYGRTAEDGTTLDHHCPRRARPYRLRADVEQPGDISFDGRSQSSTQSRWTFDVSAAPGAFALITRRRNFPAETPRIGIRRNLQIRGDTDLGNIDLNHEAAFEMQRQAIVVLNQLPEERSSFSVSLLAGGTRVSLVPPGHLGPVPLAPDALLLPIDEQILTITTAVPQDSTALRRSRGIARELRAGPPLLVMLPDLLESVAMESSQHRTTVVWEDLPTHDVALLSSSSLGNSLLPSRSHRFVASRTFLQETGARGLTLDVRGIPGMKSEWLHDPVLDLSEAFSISRTVEGEERASTVSKLTRVLDEATASTAATKGTADLLLFREGDPIHLEDPARTAGAP